MAIQLVESRWDPKAMWSNGDAWIMQNKTISIKDAYESIDYYNGKLAHVKDIGIPSQKKLLEVKQMMLIDANLARSIWKTVFKMLSYRYKIHDSDMAKAAYNQWPSVVKGRNFSELTPKAKEYVRRINFYENNLIYIKEIIPDIKDWQRSEIAKKYGHDKKLPKIPRDYIEEEYEKIK